MATEIGIADWSNLRFNVHRLTTGELASSLIVRTWSGASAWDRRLSPLSPLAAPPLAPPGVDPRLWAVEWAVARLRERTDR